MGTVSGNTLTINGGTAVQTVAAAAAVDAETQTVTVDNTKTVLKTRTIREKPKTVTVEKTRTVRFQGSASFQGDGVYLVGSDIQPGTYRSRPAADSVTGYCYWARLSNTSGDLDGIIANANPSGPFVVTISRSDKAFEVNGCEPFRKIG